ncbi:ADP-ribosyltransferase [Lactiplantibacillus plantarum]|uniref:ADP-ribosyltransferase n=1 Tax=Lactiplantibacillus plantarum TaxID=1590 RepID=UPI00200090DC|nr:ADP-ribosyltransferase [Lactiplantibacillus plantarum]
MPSGKFEDFKENKEEAKKFGEKEAKNWELTDKQKKSVAEYVSSRTIQEAAKSQLFLPKSHFEEQDKVAYERLENLAKGVDKAKLNLGVVSYKNVTEKDIGFNNDLASGNALDKVEFKKFQKQFEGEIVKLDNFYDSKITSENSNPNNRVLLKVKVPSTKGTTFKPHTGIYMDEKSEPHLLVDHSYGFLVEGVSKIVIKGKECVKVDGMLKPNIDFANNDSEAKSYGTKTSADWRESLSPNEVSVFEGYLKQDYKEINPYLRDPNSKPDSKLDEKIETMTNALERKEIPEGLTVYRWAGAKEFGYEIGKVPPLEKFESDWLGQTREEAAYMSTSLYNSDPQFQSARPIVLRLYLPKGTHAGYLSAAPFTGYESELELLLDKGYKYKITRVKEMTIKGKKKYLVDATLLLK